MDLDGRSGSQLREELENTIAERNALREELHSLKVANLIREKGFEHVKVEDLRGVPLDKVEEKAAEINQERLKQEEDLVRAGLARRGWSEEEIEDFIAGNQPERVQQERRVQESVDRIRSLQNVDSEMPSKMDKYQGLVGRDLMLVHFEDQERMAKRAKGRL